MASKAATGIINAPLPNRARRWAFKMLRPKDHAYYRWLRDNVEPGSQHSLTGYLENRCIFVHIPKCAGISVCQSLFGNNGGSHMGARQYALAFSDEEFREFFKFTFVRNPWSRLYSAYRFLRSGGRSPADRQWFEQHLSKYQDFGEFVRRWVTPGNIWSYPHFVPQHYFIEDCRGQIHLDFVGRLESIEEDFGHVCRVLSIDAKLQHRNAGESRGGRDQDVYDDETASIVGGMYSQDANLFGYSGPATRP